MSDSGECLIASGAGVSFGTVGSALIELVEIYAAGFDRLNQRSGLNQRGELNHRYGSKAEFRRLSGSGSSHIGRTGLQLVVNNHSASMQAATTPRRLERIERAMVDCRRPRQRSSASSVGSRPRKALKDSIAGRLPPASRISVR